MTNLNSFLISFCVSSIFIGAFYIICPTGQISKSVRYIFCLVFTITVISSALKVNFKLEYPHENTVSIDNSSSLDTASAVYVYSECLKSAGIDFSEISVLTNKTEDNRIVISKVLIFSNEEKSKILDALSVIAQNLEVEVINE